MHKSLANWLKQNSWRKTGLALVSASLIVSSFTVIIKELGGFEYFDLRVYDQLIRLRSTEEKDNRLLTVLITEADIQKLGKWPLSDEVLAQTLNNLLQHHPYGIGIDLYRDLPVNPGEAQLNHLFRQSSNISGVCKLESATEPPVPPPPSLPIELVGFADIPLDGDGVVRRNLFYVEPQGSICNTPYSLGLQMALSYLMARGVEPKMTEDGLLQLGEATFQPIDSRMGAYHHIDSSGYQIMIDYARGENPTPTVTLSEVLQGKVNPQLITDKIILIGVSAPSLKDTFYTPFSRQGGDVVLMPGVTLHSYMASQILSSALDGKPLIWGWQEWQEVIWVYLWGLAGSASILLLSRPLLMMVTQLGAMIVIVATGVLIFFIGGWIPLVPPFVAFLGGAIALMGYHAYQAKQEQLTIQQQVAEQEKSIAMLQMLLANQSQISHPSSLFRYDQGSVIVNRYQIVKALGKGSFGSTYLARDLLRPGKPYCVVKRLTPSSQEAKFLKIVQRLFRTEAKILEKVGTHKKIPQLLAYIEENNEFFLVQEYIEGKTIFKELKEKGKYSEKEVLILLEEIISILVFIQEYNLIHRDIKPDNIIRRNSDHSIVLIDFGAVKQISRQNDQKTVIIGNEGYAAPEQLAGQPSLSSDIYATGMVAIHCLTGTIPHKLPKDETTGAVIWNSQDYVSKSTASIIKKMTHYHFGDRYQNAQEVMRDLKRFKQKLLLHR